LKPAICIEMLYPGLSAPEKIQKIAAHGFGYVEFWGHGDKDIEALHSVCAQTGSRIINFSANRKGSLVDSSTHPGIVEEIRASLEVAKKLGTNTLMVLSNELGEGGRVMDDFARIPDSVKRADVVAGLKKIAAILPRDFSIVLEPLNTVLDHVGNFLSSSAQGADILAKVDDPRFRLLCDFYHMALMGEDPVTTAKTWASAIRHVHIADYPGRHEPGTGRGRWLETLRALRDSGFKGYVGFEFSPAGDSDLALDAVGKLWSEALGAGPTA
jgi:hydroxypyruvate isomerase